MPKIVVDSADTLAGEYELDLSHFTHREWSIIKREAGVRAGEFWDALNAGDADVILALAVVAMRRAGKDPSRYEIDALWDTDAGKITLDASDVEDDADPPDGNGLPESGSPSLPDSTESSESSELTWASPTGDPGSGTGST